MARMGHCPSGRLFEAAACGVAIVSDEWAGLETFFEPGVVIIVARNTGDVIAAMRLPRAELERIARASRQRVLESHTAAHRAAELERFFQTARGIPTNKTERGSAGYPLSKRMIAEA